MDEGLSRGSPLREFFRLAHECRARFAGSSRLCEREQLPPSESGMYGLLALIPPFSQPSAHHWVRRAGQASTYVQAITSTLERKQE